MNYIIKDYSEYWAPKLIGEQPPFTDSAICLGWWLYKTNRHNNGGDPVVIWVDQGDNQLHCMIGKRDVDLRNVFGVKSDNEEDWTRLELFMTYLLDHPVSLADYLKRMETGYWPGIHPDVGKAMVAEEAAGIGHNNPPSSIFDDLREKIMPWAVSAANLVQLGAAKTQLDHDEACTLAETLRALRTQAEKERKAEKDPFWEKCKEIDRKWNPIIDEAGIYAKVNEVVVSPFQRRLAREKEERLRQERAEADRLAREAAAAKKRAEDEAQRLADEAARASATGEEVDEKANAVAIEEVARQADELTEQAEEAQRQADQTAKTTIKGGGLRGKAISLRTFTTYEVTDRKLAGGHFRNNGEFLKEIDALIVKYARPLIQSGQQVPGVKVITEERAA